jgi:hypothetical protein
VVLITPMNTAEGELCWFDEGEGYFGYAQMPLHRPKLTPRWEKALVGDSSATATTLLFMLGLDTRPPIMACTPVDYVDVMGWVSMIYSKEQIPLPSSRREVARCGII